MTPSRLSERQQGGRGDGQPTERFDAEQIGPRVGQEGGEGLFGQSIAGIGGSSSGSSRQVRHLPLMK